MCCIATCVILVLFTFVVFASYGGKDSAIRSGN